MKEISGRKIRLIGIFPNEVSKKMEPAMAPKVP
jgi:hypothetical protein